MTLTTTQSAELSKALDRVRTDKREVADQLRAARNEYGKLQHRLTEGKANPDEAFAAQKEVNVLEGRQKDLREEEATYLGLLGQATNGNAVPHGDGEGGSGVVSYLDDPEKRATIANVLASSGRVGRVDLARISPDVFMSWTGKALTPEAFGRPEMRAAAQSAPTLQMERGPFYGIVPFRTYPTTFLDLLASQAVEHPSTPYAQETPTTGTGPAPAAPGTVKPLMDTQYQDAKANTTTIAAYLTANKQTLADVPTLQMLMEQRMLVKLRQKLEAQVLSGDGTVSDVSGEPGLTGLLATTGVGAINPTAGTKIDPDIILDAITTVEVSGSVPNFVALNPTNYADLAKAKASTSGVYHLNPYEPGPPRVHDVPMIKAIGVPAGKVICGDSTGILLFIRQGGTMYVSDNDVDNFERNKVTLLCEGRFSLGVLVPSAFVVVTLT